MAFFDDGKENFVALKCVVVRPCNNYQTPSYALSIRFFLNNMFVLPLRMHSEGTLEPRSFCNSMFIFLRILAKGGENHFLKLRRCDVITASYPTIFVPSCSAHSKIPGEERGRLNHSYFAAVTVCVCLCEGHAVLLRIIE